MKKFVFVLVTLLIASCGLFAQSTQSYSWKENEKGCTYANFSIRSDSYDKNGARFIPMKGLTIGYNSATQKYFIIFPDGNGVARVEVSFEKTVFGFNMYKGKYIGKDNFPERLKNVNVMATVKLSDFTKNAGSSSASYIDENYKITITPVAFVDDYDKSGLKGHYSYLIMPVKNK